MNEVECLFRCLGAISISCVCGELFRHVVYPGALSIGELHLICKISGNIFPMCLSTCHFVFAMQKFVFMQPKLLLFSLRLLDFLN